MGSAGVIVGKNDAASNFVDTDTAVAVASDDADSNNNARTRSQPLCTFPGNEVVGYTRQVTRWQSVVQIEGQVRLCSSRCRSVGLVLCCRTNCEHVKAWKPRPVTNVLRKYERLSAGGTGSHRQCLLERGKTPAVEGRLRRLWMWSNRGCDAR